MSSCVESCLCCVVMVGGEDPAHRYCDCCSDGGEDNQLLEPPLLRGLSPAPWLTPDGSLPRGRSPLPWLTPDSSPASSRSSDAPPLPPRPIPRSPIRSSPLALRDALYSARLPLPAHQPSPCHCDGCTPSQQDEDSIYEEVGFQYYSNPGVAGVTGGLATVGLEKPPSRCQWKRGSLGGPPDDRATCGLLGTSAVVFPDAVFPLKAKPSSTSSSGVGGVLRSLGVCGRTTSHSTVVETVSTCTLDDLGSGHSAYGSGTYGSGTCGSGTYGSGTYGSGTYGLGTNGSDAFVKSNKPPSHTRRKVSLAPPQSMHVPCVHDGPVTSAWEP